MKTLQLFLLLLFCLPHILNAQVSGISQTTQTYFENYQQLKIREGETDPTIEGTPYFFDEFITGSLYHGSADSMKAVIRYNIYTDLIEVKKNNQLFGVEKDTSKVNSFRINEVTFELIPVEYNKEPFTYAQVITKGNYTLYAKQSVDFQRAKEVKAFQEATPAKFVRNPEVYYLKDIDNNYTKIKSFSDIIDLFPAITEELTAYVKKNKLKFKNDEDKISFINYLSSKK